jgi:hypothetical protein
MTRAASISGLGVLLVEAPDLLKSHQPIHARERLERRGGAERRDQPFLQMPGATIDIIEIMEMPGA